MTQNMVFSITGAHIRNSETEIEIDKMIDVI